MQQTNSSGTKGPAFTPLDAATNTHLYFHVFTPDGDCYVSDSSDGDLRLAVLLKRYPNAAVMTKDRDTDEVAAEELSLRWLLQEERGFLSISIGLGGRTV